MLQPRKRPIQYGKHARPRARAPVRRHSTSSDDSESDKENVRIVIQDTDDEEESRQIAQMLGTPPVKARVKPRAVVKPSPLRPAVIRRRLKSPQPPIRPPVIDVDSSIEEIEPFGRPVASRHDCDPAIAPLLEFCSQLAPYDFDSLVSCVGSLLGFSAPVEWRKLGEATYSEVFTIAPKSAAQADSIVAKIIPLRTRAAVMSDDVPEETDWADALRELRMTRLLGDDADTPGFVQLRRACIVQGPYPERLLSEWDAFADRRGSLNVRPDALPDDQLYAIICLPYQGVDIESVKLSSWTEAASIVLQVARSLAAAEGRHQFEHRDLHWGNVLIAKVSEADKLAARMARTNLQDEAQAWTATLEPGSSGVRTTIIDYTLSRAGDQWSTIDELVFEGEGDAQFDVYRAMREAVTSGEDEDWAGFHPITNLQWLHYLISKLIHDKQLAVPVMAPTKERSRRGAQPARKPTSAADREAYSRLLDAEDLLAKSVDLRRKKKARATLCATSRDFLDRFSAA